MSYNKQNFKLLVCSKVWGVLLISATFYTKLLFYPGTSSRKNRVLENWKHAQTQMYQSIGRVFILRKIIEISYF
jgi:hypothetical protein